MDYEAEKAGQKIDRLERQLTETTQKLQYYTDTGATVTLEGGKTIGGLSRARVSVVPTKRARWWDGDFLEPG